MSIFNSTFPLYVAGQINARRDIINIPARKGDFMRYVSGKNAWVRMVSQVNVGGKDDLSRQWVLYGGVPAGGTTDGLRYGVGGIGDLTGVYNSDLNSTLTKASQYTTYQSSTVERPYGYRPMPGITSFESINKGTFGSLRQTTVKFTCWDKYQLQQLEKLYMRPGFSVFVEWGWSMFINHDIPASINTSPGSKVIENFTTWPIDPFKITDISSTYKTIQDAAEKYRGNYFAALGYVTNYSWQMMPNGGFECTTVIISHGNAINEIKASSNPFTLIGSGILDSDQTLSSTLDPSTGNLIERPVLSNFEKIMLNLKAYFNQTELFDGKGEFFVQFDNPSGGSIPNSTREKGAKNIQANVVKTVDNIRSEIQKYTAKNPLRSKVGFKTGALTYTAPYPFNPDIAVLKPTKGSSNGTAFEYILFNELIAILETFFMPKDKNGKAIVKITAPGDGRFAACEDTVSIDPTVCLFTNFHADFLVSGSGIYGDNGFVPSFYKPTMASITSLVSASFDPKSKDYFHCNPINVVGYNNDNDRILNLQLGRILINIDCILETYRGLINSDGVSIIDFLNALLEKISFALGGVNDFKIYNQGNFIEIIDVKYLETSNEGRYDSKFRFDLIGLKSVCRDVKINSRVFSEQASMIAIAAANAGNKANTQANLGDLYTSTQQYLNYGLKDRIIQQAYITDPSQAAARPNISQSLWPYYDLYWSTIDPLEKYLKRKVIGYPPTSDPSGVQSIVIPTQDEIQNAYSLLNSHLLQLNAKDLDYKAVIPFELEITLDGIAGFNIGEVYTIDQSVLPDVYTGTTNQDRKVGFILTGVQHQIQNNDWTTTLQGQMCLIENNLIKNDLRKQEKDKIKSIVSGIRKATSKTSYLAWAMVDYLIFLTINILSKDGKQKCDNINNLFLDKTEFLTTWYRGVSPTCAYGVKEYHTQLKSEDVLLKVSSTQTNLGTSAEEKALNLAKASINLYAQQLAPFYNSDRFDATKTNTYLYKWWEKLSTQSGLVNFPATFKELLVYDDGAGTEIDLSPHLFSTTYGSKNFNNWILNITPTTLRNGFTPKDIFIYREFPVPGSSTEFDPITALKSSKTTKSDCKPPIVFAYYGLNLTALRDTYNGFVSNHINNDWGGDRGFVQSSAAGSNVSLEVDLAPRDRLPGYLYDDSNKDMGVGTPSLKTSDIPWYVGCK